MSSLYPIVISFDFKGESKVPPIKKKYPKINKSSPQKVKSRTWDMGYALAVGLSNPLASSTMHWYGIGCGKLLRFNLYITFVLLIVITSI